MITTDQAFDIHGRIRAARRSRCGGDALVQPPTNWAAIVRERWPLVWSQDPSRCPDGWVDLLMAFSEHAMQIAGGGLFPWCPFLVLATVGGSAEVALSQIKFVRADAGSSGTGMRRSGS